MKILVSGKTGQVGWQLERVLPSVGETIAVGRETLDLTRPDTIRKTIRAVRPDVIVNAAGYTHVDSAESKPELMQVNAVAPGIMAEEAKRIGAIFVHYSSVYLFDGTRPSPYTEGDAPNPINEYGRSKLAGEHAITQVDGTHLILRASWVYDTRARNFVLTMLRLAAEREELRVVDDQVGSPTWARSIAETTAAILRDIPRARAAAGVYNLSALGAVSRHDFTQRMLELTRDLRSTPAPRLVRFKTTDFPLPAARPLNSALDNTKLAATFAVPLTDWETQLRGCLRSLSRTVPEISKQA